MKHINLFPLSDFSPYSIVHSHDDKRLLEWFYSYDINEYITSLQDVTREEWERRSQKQALSLFRDAAIHVPAYADFLKKHHINPEKILTISDFCQVPVIDKKNYITQYPLEALCWDGTLVTNRIVSYSSGSTGTPYLWPRGTYQDVEGAVFHEHLLVNQFHIDTLSTAIFVCFSLGNYMAGTYTLSCLELIAKKKYPLTVITPGINYKDTFRMMRELAAKFDQVIFCGYPPFLKDIIDLGEQEGIDWKKNTVKFLFASEFFSEEWREFMLEKTKFPHPLLNSTNIYGAADATLFGFETPMAIYLRKLASDDPDFHVALFGNSLTPTLVQYNPLARYFELVNQELLLSSFSGIPLVRYNLHDRGGILFREDIEQLLSKRGITMDQISFDNDVKRTLTDLPFVYIMGRTDGAASYYGILIYPEYIRDAIEERRYRKILSGKFTIIVKHGPSLDPYMEVHVEQQKGVHRGEDFAIKLKDTIIQSLRMRSAEFNLLSDSIKDKCNISVILHQKAEEPYFGIGIKQRWVSKQ